MKQNEDYQANPLWRYGHFSTLVFGALVIFWRSGFGARDQLVLNIINLFSLNIRVIVFMQVFRLKLESVWSVDICGTNFRFSQKIRVIVVDFFSPDR